MPKLGKFYNIQITFDARDELREKLVALSYLRGDAGKYAPIARDIMTEAVERFVADLDPQERKEFAEILKNVQAVTVIDKMEREERLRQALKMRGESSS
jgi:hypothetical protein